MRKESCHAAYPRVAGNANNHVVLATIRMEERCCVVDENVDARVVVTAVVPRIESLRQIHHRLLDFYAVKVFEQGVCKQVMCAHAATEANHRSIIRLGLHGHRHKGGCCLCQFIARNRGFAVLAHASVGLAVRLHVVMHWRFVETDGCCLSVNHLDLFVGVHVLVTTEYARGNERRVELYKNGRHNHHAHHDVEHHAVAETLAVNHQ